jgi:hypothetical protein
MNEWVKTVWGKIKLNTFFFVTTITGLIVLLRLGVGFIGVLSFFYLAFFVKYIVLKQKFNYFFLKGLVTITLLVSLIWFLPKYIGWTWFLVLILAYVVYRVWRGRDLLVDAMRQIEVILFGKSLDKNNWENGDTPSFKSEEYKNKLKGEKKHDS